MIFIGCGVDCGGLEGTCICGDDVGESDAGEGRSVANEGTSVACVGDEVAGIFVGGGEGAKVGGEMGLSIGDEVGSVVGTGAMGAAVTNGHTALFGAPRSLFQH